MGKKQKDVESILVEALRQSNTEERRAYLEATCGSDIQLRAEIDSLLLAYEDKASLLKAPPDLLEEPAGIVTEGPGTIIGRYKLLEKIGEGGMAVVYMAGQEKPLHRKVALKIIKLGMDTKSVITRFEVERQALAMMEHPNIAKVLDAGATETGRPYFVMELVKGVSITDYCDKNKLNTKERLDLFISICNAIQHAHQKGIIHRDIKPSNVMVTLRDGKPVPKVIDFGIAKATSQKLTEKTLFTRYAQMIGTPVYMSPEQTEFSELDIDTRTDIYSLGVLLYELMTGTTPFDEERLRSAGYAEMQSIIREEEPVKPSTKLSTMGKTLTEVAEHRKTDPGLLTKLLCGDLDWIVMKSLEKDRARRYHTAVELSADITRHLNYEPVLAGPPSQIYRLRKFIHRHRTQAIGVVMVAVLLACMAVIFVMYVQAVNRGKQAEFLEHTNILSKAIELRSTGQFQEALDKVGTILDSEHVGPKAHLLRGRLVLELQGPVVAVKELQGLLNERDEVACQAHFLLARIYLESDPGEPETTEEYQQKAKENQQKGEKLFSESAEAYFNRSIMAGTVNKTLEWLNKAIDLDPGHYDSREARALAYYALRKYDKMEIDASVMIGIESNNSQGYALRAIARREKVKEEAEAEKELLGEALRDHNKAITLSPDEAELYDQRRQTQMQMGNYEEALLDARKCAELEPEERIHRFHVFCALVASGYYDEAKVEYGKIIKSGLITKNELGQLAAKYVSDTLDAGLSWYPPESRPEGAAFLEMHESAEIYEQLAKKAKRVVPEGFHATWSLDGTELAYSCGIHGFSGIEIINLESGKTRLLTVPGFDPAWSPDGQHIAYVRVRQLLLLADVTTKYGAEIAPVEQREVWLIKSDGTEDPSFLARGHFPCWSRDSTRVFYHSPKDMKVYSISIEDGAEPTPVIWSPSYYPVVSPDEKYVAYWHGQLQIVEISTKSVVASSPVPLSFPGASLNWSPNGRELSIGEGLSGHGLWIYNLDTKTVSKFLSGPIGWSSWSRPDMSRFAFQRIYGFLRRGIWVADLDPNVSTTEALGAGRTIKEHCREMVDYYTRRIETDPEDAGNYLSRARYYHILDDTDNERADMERYRSILNPPKGTSAHKRWVKDLIRQQRDSRLLFGTPTNLGPTVNSSGNDVCPDISADGLTLYFTSDRIGGYGRNDLYVTTRETIDDEWSEPVNLGPTVNSAYNDLYSGISADGLSLYFTSNRPGGLGGWDLWVTTRATTEDDWSDPVNLGPTVNGSSTDSGPCISADGLSLFFYSRRPGGHGSLDIWVTTRATKDGDWGLPVNLGPAVNTAYGEVSPSISANGLLLFFNSSRPGGEGGSDLWFTMRSTIDGAWSAPVNLGPNVNSSDADRGPCISGDGKSLFFESWRSGVYRYSCDLWQVKIDIVDNLTDKQDIKEP